MSAFELNDSDGDFLITLGPGVVKYFSTKDFLGARVDDVISKLNSFPGKIKLDFPMNLFGLDNLIPTDDWESRLRAYHAFSHLCSSKNMPPLVYMRFHHFLALKEFAFEECLNAWIRNAADSQDILDSYHDSKEHIVVRYEQATKFRKKDLIVSDAHVFAKTPFVIEKLKALEVAAGDKTAAAELELLRKSKFDCFVYLMEDLRNKSFKIGKSKTPGKRERTLQSEIPQIVMRFSIPAEERHEKHLHEHFGDKRKRGEWFELSNDDLLWIVSYLKNNGDASRATVDYQWLGIVSF